MAMGTRAAGAMIAARAVYASCAVASMSRTCLSRQPQPSDGGGGTDAGDGESRMTSCKPAALRMVCALDPSVTAARWTMLVSSSRIVLNSNSVRAPSRTNISELQSRNCFAQCCCCAAQASAGLVHWQPYTHVTIAITWVMLSPHRDAMAMSVRRCAGWHLLCIDLLEVISPCKPSWQAMIPAKNSCAVRHADVSRMSQRRLYASLTTYATRSFQPVDSENLSEFRSQKTTTISWHTRSTLRHARTKSCEKLRAFHVDQCNRPPGEADSSSGSRSHANVKQMLCVQSSSANAAAGCTRRAVAAAVPNRCHADGAASPVGCVAGSGCW